MTTPTTCPDLCPGGRLLCKNYEYPGGEPFCPWHMKDSPHHTDGSPCEHQGAKPEPCPGERRKNPERRVSGTTDRRSPNEPGALRSAGRRTFRSLDDLGGRRSSPVPAPPPLAPPTPGERRKEERRLGREEHSVQGWRPEWAQVGIDEWRKDRRSGDDRRDAEVIRMTPMAWEKFRRNERVALAARPMGILWPDLAEVEAWLGIKVKVQADASLQVDDPALDGTPAEHPAFRRGANHGAALVQQLQAENAQLRVERDNLTRAFHDTVTALNPGRLRGASTEEHDQWSYLPRQVAELRSERDRLVEQLQSAEKAGRAKELQIENSNNWAADCARLTEQVRVLREGLEERYRTYGSIANSWAGALLAQADAFDKERP